MRHKEVWSAERAGPVRHENGTMVVPIYVKDHNRHIDLRIVKSKVESMIMSEINMLSKM